jgi:tetratricopeptide (TPR) repeat protein
LIVLALAACAPADPAAFAEQQWSVCENSVFEQQSLDACTTVIASSAVEPARRAQALVHRGILRAQLAQDARAVADFGRALRIDRSLVSAYQERGQLHYNRRAFAAAVRDFDAALALDPNLYEVASLRDAAMRSLAEGSMGELEWLNRQIAANPGVSALWNNRCWTRAVSGENLDIALADCNEAIRLEPGSAAALDSRGLVHSLTTRLRCVLILIAGTTCTAVASRGCAWVMKRPGAPTLRRANGLSPVLPKTIRATASRRSKRRPAPWRASSPLRTFQS